MPPPNHKTRRLKTFDYVGPLAAHLVFVTAGRRQLFKSDDAVAICLEAVEESRAKHEATIHAYCLMPDHVHLLIELPQGVSLTKFARLFKQVAGHRLRRLQPDFAWQISYYDRILRDDEAITDVADYVWQNPVGAGLVQRREEYRYSGPPSRLQRPGRSEEPAPT